METNFKFVTNFVANQRDNCHTQSPLCHHIVTMIASHRPENATSPSFEEQWSRVDMRGELVDLTMSDFLRNWTEFMVNQKKDVLNSGNLRMAQKSILFFTDVDLRPVRTSPVHF